MNNKRLSVRIFTAFLVFLFFVGTGSGATFGPLPTVLPSMIFVPYYYPISINGGAAYTSTATVAVSLDSSKLGSASFGTPTYMSLSNINPWSYSWEQFSTSKTMILSGSDGEKTIYVAFRNGSSSVIGSIIGPGTSYNVICYDKIVLDTLPPTLTLTTSIANGTTLTQPSVTLSWTASDAGMGMDHSEIKVDSNTWTNIGDLTSYSFPLTNGAHTLAVKAVDKTSKTQVTTLNIIVTLPVDTPTVVINPTVKVVEVGETATFTATSSGGSGSYTTYAWYQGTSLIPDKTTSTLTITADKEGTYTYFCNVTDTNEKTSKSNEATLVVTQANTQTSTPTITPTPTPPTGITLTPSPHPSIDPVIINGGAQAATSTSITLTINANGVMTDASSMRFSNDNSIWSSWEPYSNTKTWTLSSGPGNKEVYVQFKNTGGDESQVVHSAIAIAATQTEEFPIALVAVGSIVAVVIVLIVVFLFLKRRKPSGPAEIKISAEPVSLVADGTAQSIISLQLLDKKGKPISAMSDTTIKLKTSKGTVQQPIVTIPKGQNAVKTVIVSPTEPGPTPVSANADGLKSITITLNFTDRARYCMHCGTQMSLKDKACRNCGKMPPAGADTKVCQNCQSVIPVVAKFCSECGTGQPV